MPLSTLKPLGRETLWDGAYAALRALLFSGRLAPGERIVLRDVAQELGISLTPVRDAVNRLIAERILERGASGHGGGATVPRISADQFRQLVTIRASLEPIAAAEAARRSRPADLVRVERALRDMKLAVEEQRLERYLEAHHRFHFGIHALSGQSEMEGIIENIWLRCSPVLTLVLPEYVPGLKRNEFHADALAALRRGDPQGAADAIRADIEGAGQYLAGLLERESRSREEERRSEEARSGRRLAV